MDNFEEKLTNLLKCNNLSRKNILSNIDDKTKRRSVDEKDRTYKKFIDFLESNKSDHFFNRQSLYLKVTKSFYVKLLESKINPFRRSFDLDEYIVRIRNLDQNWKKNIVKWDWIYKLITERKISIKDVEDLIHFYKLIYEDLCYVHLKPIAQNLVINNKISLEGHLNRYNKESNLKKISNAHLLEVLCLFDSEKWRCIFDPVKNYLKNPESHASYDIDKEKFSINFIDGKKINPVNFANFAYICRDIFFLYNSFEMVGGQVQSIIYKNQS